MLLSQSHSGHSYKALDAENKPFFVLSMLDLHPTFVLAVFSLNQMQVCVNQMLCSKKLKDNVTESSDTPLSWY